MNGEEKPEYLQIPRRTDEIPGVEQSPEHFSEVGWTNTLFTFITNKNISSGCVNIFERSRG